jgi:hypothetical protein
LYPGQIYHSFWPLIPHYLLYFKAGVAFKAGVVFKATGETGQSARLGFGRKDFHTQFRLPWREVVRQFQGKMKKAILRDFHGFVNDRHFAPPGVLKNLGTILA